MAKATKPNLKPKEEDKPTKTSFNLKPSLMKKLKYISWKSEQSQTELVDKALNDLVNIWEKKNGAIPFK
jgi:hypothetical protein